MIAFVGGPHDGILRKDTGEYHLQIMIQRPMYSLDYFINDKNEPIQVEMVVYERANFSVYNDDSSHAEIISYYKPIDWSYKDVILHLLKMKNKE